MKTRNWQIVEDFQANLNAKDEKRICSIGGSQENETTFAAEIKEACKLFGAQLS